jgi:hypothetical protein
MASVSVRSRSRGPPTRAAPQDAPAAEVEMETKYGDGADASANALAPSGSAAGLSDAGAGGVAAAGSADVELVAPQAPAAATAHAATAATQPSPSPSAPDAQAASAPAGEGAASAVPAPPKGPDAAADDGAELDIIVSDEAVPEADEKQVAAATKIQALWRGHRVRAQLDREISAIVDIQARRAIVSPGCLTSVQRVVRGFLARRSFRRMQEEMDASDQRRDKKAKSRFAAPAVLSELPEEGTGEWVKAKIAATMVLLRCLPTHLTNARPCRSNDCGAATWCDVTAFS